MPEENSTGQQGGQQGSGAPNRRSRRRRPNRNRRGPNRPGGKTNSAGPENARKEETGSAPASGKQEQRGTSGNRAGSKRNPQNRRRRRKQPEKKHLFDFQAEINRSAEEFRAGIKQLKESRVSCHICNEPISDMLSALYFKENNELCHFECIQKELSKSEELGKDEQLVYIGNGDFGVIQKRRSRGKAYFFMRKRISYRDKGSPHKVHHDA